VSAASNCLQPMPDRAKDTAINDTVFDSYHVFRSEVRMLPAGSTVEEQKPHTDTPAPPMP